MEKGRESPNFGRKTKNDGGTFWQQCQRASEGAVDYKTVAVLSVLGSKLWETFGTEKRCVNVNDDDKERTYIVDEVSFKETERRPRGS